MQLKKIFGWILLIAGLVIIFWTLYSTYNIFTAKAAVPEVFKIEEGQLPSQKSEAEPSNPEELQEEMKKMLEEQIKKLIPSEFLIKLLNLISWSILVSILIFGGSKISGIGIRLIKGE